VVPAPDPVDVVWPSLGAAARPRLRHTLQAALVALVALVLVAGAAVACTAAWRQWHTAATSLPSPATCAAHVPATLLHAPRFPDDAHVVRVRNSTSSPCPQGTSAFAPASRALDGADPWLYTPGPGDPSWDPSSVPPCTLQGLCLTPSLAHPRPGPTCAVPVPTGLPPTSLALADVASCYCVRGARGRWVWPLVLSPWPPHADEDLCQGVNEAVARASGWAVVPGLVVAVVNGVAGAVLPRLWRRVPVVSMVQRERVAALWVLAVQALNAGAVRCVLLAGGGGVGGGVGGAGLGGGVWCVWGVCALGQGLERGGGALYH
jgi:hypothetical protein